MGERGIEMIGIEARSTAGKRGSGHFDRPIVSKEERILKIQPENKQTQMTKQSAEIFATC